MIIIDSLEELRKSLNMTQKDFYNVLLGTDMKFSRSNKSITSHIFKESISSTSIARFKNRTSISTVISQRFQELSQNNYLDDLGKHYKSNLNIEDNTLKAFKQKLNAVGANIGYNGDDLYLYLAYAVNFCISNFRMIKKSNQLFIPNCELIYDQMIRIFTDEKINYIAIATQVGMILVTDDSVRNAVKEYLKKGKTLKVVINSPDIRNVVGAHMRNPEISHQTDTYRILELWKKLKEEVGNANLLVAITDLPILHQVIKSSTKINNSEQNVSVEVRMYSYLVRDKNENISFTMTAASDKYAIIEEELEYLLLDAVKDFIITDEIKN